MDKQTLVATALLAIVALNACPSVYADNVPGWSATLFPPTVFVGDSLNVTIKGTELNHILKVSLTSPNGTLLETRFIRMLNYSAIYKHQFPLEEEPGNYTVHAYVNESLVLEVEFRLIFDEQNYQAKRLAILEKQTQELQRQIAIERSATRELRAQVDGFWWLVYLGGFLLFVALAACVVLKIIVAYLAAWRYPYSEILSAYPRFIRAAFAPRGAGDLRSTDYTRNFRFNPLEADGVVRALFRQAGRPEPTLPGRNPWSEEAKLKPLVVPERVKVRRLKVGLSKKGTSGDVDNREATLSTWQSSLEAAKERYKDSPEVLDMFLSAHEAEVQKSRANLMESLKARAEKSSAPPPTPNIENKPKES